MASQMKTSATARYMNFSPQLVNERNKELNKCETKEGRSAIYRAYYFKLKDAYEKACGEEDTEEETETEEEDEEYVVSEEEDEESEEDDTEVGEEEDETDVDDEDASEADPSEADEDCDDEACEDEACEDEDCDDHEEEVDEEPAEKEFGCDGCEYEWKDGWRKGWKAAMKHISKYAHKTRRATPPSCETCGNNHDLRKCGGCNAVRYCSTECQKEHWRFEHKHQCASMIEDY